MLGRHLIDFKTKGWEIVKAIYKGQEYIQSATVSWII